jgi:SRSO17 transposase
MNKNRVPKASPEPLPELAAFLEPFAPLFRRHTSRESMERYLTGLLTDLPHKTCETIADVIAGITSERLQHLLTDAAWDPLELDEARVKRLLKSHPVPTASWCLTIPAAAKREGFGWRGPAVLGDAGQNWTVRWS